MLPDTLAHIHTTTHSSSKHNFTAQTLNAKKIKCIGLYAMLYIIAASLPFDGFFGHDLMHAVEYARVFFIFFFLFSSPIRSSVVFCCCIFFFVSQCVLRLMALLYTFYFSLSYSLHLFIAFTTYSHIFAAWYRFTQLNDIYFVARTMSFENKFLIHRKFIRVCCLSVAPSSCLAFYTAFATLQRTYIRGSPEIKIWSAQMATETIKFRNIKTNLSTFERGLLAQMSCLTPERACSRSRVYDGILYYFIICCKQPASWAEFHHFYVEFMS